MLEKINLRTLITELIIYTFIFGCGVFIGFFFTGFAITGMILGLFFDFIVYINFSSVKDSTGTNFIRKSEHKKWWKNKI